MLIYFKNFLLLSFSFALSFIAFATPVLALTLTATENVAVSAKVGEDAPAQPGGGGSGSVAMPRTSVRFSGLAYPGATVRILVGTLVRVSVVADATGAFSATLEEKKANFTLYSLYATDVSGNRSLIINYPIAVYGGHLTHLSGIKFAPTISVDKSEVGEGGYLTATGYSLSGRNLEIAISGKKEAFYTLTSSSNGSYKIVLPLADLPRGEYTVSVKYGDDERASKFLSFYIGSANVDTKDSVTRIPGDLNRDSKVDLVDFSILAYWYGKNSPPREVDPNIDGQINLVDFSILAFWWTG